MCEKKRYQTYTEFHKTIRTEMKILQENFLYSVLEVSQKAKPGVSNIISDVQYKFANRRKAIDEMMKTMIQFLLPVSHKYLMYVAENAADFTQISLSVESKKPSIQEDLTKATRQVEKYGRELMRENEVRHFLKISAINFKKSVQKLIQFEKDIQRQVAALDQFVFDKVIPCLTSHKICDFLEWATTVSSSLNVGI